MTPTRRGSIRLFRFAGIDLFLHWSWFLVAAMQISLREARYSSFIWNIFEYLTLFVIVLLHEFGHALACRQVGGRANQIVLWPLGGVAYVAPPPRPGATLWSIAAGPLVNVALLPVLSGLWFVAARLGWDGSMPDAYEFVRAVCIVNIVLLMFNMLPVYPLDGGQILRSLLWFVVGRARSLFIATIVGLVGVAGLLTLAFWAKSVWFGVLSIFILLNCWGGLQHARILLRIAKLPRREGFRCPSCKSAPPIGPFWVCSRCRNGFDTFVTRAMCPHCAVQFEVTQCLDCGEMRPFGEWMIGPPISPQQIDS